MSLDRIIIVNMLFYINLACALAVIVPAVAGVIRIKRIAPACHPFVIIVWACFLNEFLGTLLIFTWGSNACLYNIFGLLYPLLILWQFYRWRSPRTMKGVVAVAGILLAGCWTAEFMHQHDLNGYYHFFAIARDMVIVCCAVWFIRDRSRLLAP